MTADAAEETPKSASAWLFAFAVFSGAALVFLVEPMVAKLVLPLLGGSPNVWNTSLAFFQAALLAGYGYAHLLQKLSSVRRQGLVHLGVLIAAALVLTPLNITGLLGEPWAGRPVLWLLSVLTLSIGAPFAALSATAPLVQAWHARVFQREGQPQPWALYAASNLGSLIALLAYPVIVEPSLTLRDQRWGWTIGYGAFFALMAVLVIAIRRRPEPPALIPPAAGEGEAVGWRQRLAWVLLAAAPSSLMLGVTAYISTDIASAPFLWVVPLALYLTTFIIAFQDRPWIPPSLGLLLQAMAIVVCAALFGHNGILIMLPVHLAAFFLTALACHQALVARRPDPAHLTDFYLCMSLGGVVGGAFNAFLAPVVFNTVLEYPVVLVLACLARPAGRGRFSLVEGYVTVVAMVMLLAGDVVLMLLDPTVGNHRIAQWAMAVAAGCAFFVRGRQRLFTLLVGGIMMLSIILGGQANPVHAHRSFFGVVHESVWPPNGGSPRMRQLTHGTTLHGVQLIDGDRCRPMVYYSPYTPIGEAFRTMQARGRPMTIGTVGLGTGTVATFVRPGDRLTFFEIDPMIVSLSGDPRTQSFDFTTRCAKGPVDYVLGDARLTLQKEPDARYDLLLIDAFSSDAVPAHLLTVEAIRIYLRKIKPDGVVVLHLSNRNLELPKPALAAARAAGGYPLFRHYMFRDRGRCYWPEQYYDSEEDAVVIARSPQVLEAFKAADRRWVTGDSDGVRPWTDDYTNLFSALVRRMVQRLNENPPPPPRRCPG